MFETIIAKAREHPLHPPLRGRCPAGQRGGAVRRHSRLAGHCEGVFWRRTDRQAIQRITLAARRFELAGKQPGARNGPLGHVAIEILALLANLVDFRSGRLDPSLDFLMRKLRRSRDAVVGALAALRRHGFLDWLRRFEPTGNEGRGPQVRQVTNAYRLALPPAAARLLSRYGQAPVPDDAIVAQAERAATLALDERAEFGDTPLGQSLARLRQSLKERESARRTEPHPGFNSKKEGQAVSA